MEQLWDKIIKGGAIVGGAIAGFFGQWNVVLTILIVVMGLDYVSGILVAIGNKSPKTETGGLSSKVGFAGLLKKGMIVLIVLLGTLMDKAIGGEAMVFQTAITCFYIANEGISIVENASLLGLPIPSVLKKALDEMKEKGGEDANVEE